MLKHVSNFDLKSIGRAFLMIYYMFLVIIFNNMIFSKNLITDLKNNPSKVGLGIKIKDLVKIILDIMEVIGE